MINKLSCYTFLMLFLSTVVLLSGGFQVDFSSNVGDPVNGLEKVAKSLLQYGVTSFCPTIVTSPDHIYHQVNVFKLR